jgi:hypothetical protein
MKPVWYGRGGNGRLSGQRVSVRPRWERTTLADTGSAASKIAPWGKLFVPARMKAWREGERILGERLAHRGRGRGGGEFVVGEVDRRHVGIIARRGQQQTPLRRPKRGGCQP